MGNPIPDEKPDDTCPACIGWLPNQLYGEIELQDGRTYRGYIYRDEEDPAGYAGILKADDGGTTPLYAGFCQADDALHMASAGPIMAQCDGVIIPGTKCNLPVDCDSPRGCVYRLG